MSRLRNRIRKADYFSDGELLRWPRDKRTTYSGLWALAEDSGCLEDDPFNWKLLLWPSPLDADITVDLLTTWRDEMIEAGKLIPYEVAGRRYLFLLTFHKHEHPRNPQFPSLPLPPWVTATTHPTDTRKCLYDVDFDAIPAPGSPCTTFEQGSYKDATTPPAQPCPVQPGPVQSLTHMSDADAPNVSMDSDFGLFYGPFPRKEKRAAAERRWKAMVQSDRLDAIAAVAHYADYAANDPDAPLMLPATFLSKGDRCWTDWVDGIPESRRRLGSGRNGRSETSSADLYEMAAEMRAARLRGLPSADDNVVNGDAL
ncbi:MAG: hypothetical protein ACLQUT_05370 [Thermoleophilia bacterium]